MTGQKDLILFIDHDENERQVIAESALIPYGYHIIETGSGDEAIGLIDEYQPDVIILDLGIEGIGPNDILAAINAKNLPIPVILLGNEGEEREGLSAFRLGAKDFIFRPIREAELIQVLERALKEVRFERQRTILLEEVQISERSAKARLREMFTLMGLGKTVTSLTNIDQVFSHVVRASIQLTQADMAGIYLRNDETNQLILKAEKNLGSELKASIGKPVHDDLAEMVMNSRETLITANNHGWGPVQPAEKDVKAVIYAPLVVHDSGLGLLFVANQERNFDPHMANLMTALSDYAAIALVNAHLFSTMQDRTRRLEQAYLQLKGQIKADELESSSMQVVKDSHQIITNLQINIERFSNKVKFGSDKAVFDVLVRQITELESLLRPYIE